ncbi:MAG: YdcF family protein [Anaerolineales bacterium]|nr:YdcF family protein [Anaerolineales bacterium]
MSASLPPTRTGRRWRGPGITLSILLAACLLVYAFRIPILTGLGSNLIVDDALHPADIIFLLNGDYNTRPFQAAELYHQGLAPRIVIAQSELQPAESLALAPNETAVALDVLQARGVPPEAIHLLTVEGGVTSTFDEASLLRQYVVAHGVDHIIVVTSAFHTRRAHWIIAKELDGLAVTIEMAAVPARGFDETDWWQSEGGLITLNNEYLKLIYYLIQYR